VQSTGADALVALVSVGELECHRSGRARRGFGVHAAGGGDVCGAKCCARVSKQAAMSSTWQVVLGSLALLSVGCSFVRN
jgi:hypothetical protein